MRNKEGSTSFIAFMEVSCIRSRNVPNLTFYCFIARLAILLMNMITIMIRAAKAFLWNFFDSLHKSIHLNKGVMYVCFTIYLFVFL